MGFGKDNKGVILKEQTQLALLALASNEVILMPSEIALEEDFRILKAEVIAHVTGLTSDEGDGLVLGMANGGLTSAAIEASIEAQGPKGRDDRIIQEAAERQEHRLGVLETQSPGQIKGNFLGKEGGPIMTDKFRWTYSNPDGWTFYIYNNGGLLTTGATVKLIATYYGVWVS